MLEKSKALLEESRKRRSYRSFLPDPIDMEVIKNCVLTAGTAPNGADKQPWHFSIVTDPDMKRRIREESEKVEKKFYDDMITDKWRSDLAKLSVNYEKPFLTQAPCLIVIFKEQYRVLEDGTKDKNYYVNESVGISIGFLIHALHNAGLASLTYTPAPPAFLRDLLGRPEGEVPVMVLVVGKPDPNYELPKLKKKTFEEIAEII